MFAVSITTLAFYCDMPISCTRNNKPCKQTDACMFHERWSFTDAHIYTTALVVMYLGTQLGDERSISHVANRFIGTGMTGTEPPEPEPELTAPATADPPGAAGAAAGAQTPGFMKAARTPPLSTAAAIVEETLQLDRDIRGPQPSCTRSVRRAFSSRTSLTDTDLLRSGAGLRTLPARGGR